MKYFKIVQQNEEKSTMEINRKIDGDFHIVIISMRGDVSEIDLSPTEANELSEFIQKRLSEKEPDEAQPF